MLTGSLNSRKSVCELAPGVFWVGSDRRVSSLHCNPYLILDGEEGILIDPGSPLDFDIVKKNVESLCPLERITSLILHHQDPDLAASAPLFARSGMKARILTHRRTSSILRYFGIDGDWYFVDENAFAYETPSGRLLRFIPTPYLHFSGSIATFDESTGSLFSSDLFGAFSETDDAGLFADSSYREPMASFHQSYMPSHAIMHPVIELFSTLPMKRICPQHGKVIAENLSSFVDILKELECGTYALPVREALTTIGLGGPIDPVRARLEKLETKHLELESQLMRSETARRKLEHDLTRDDVTGFRNERYFRRFLSDRFEFAALTNEIGCLLGCALDPDASMGKLFGAKAKDELLAKIARFFENQVPGNASAFRTGVDRFAFFLPAFSLEDGIACAEELRAALHETDALGARVKTSFAVIDLGHFLSGGATPSERTAMILDRIDALVESAWKKGGDTVLATTMDDKDACQEPLLYVIDDDIFHVKLLEKHFIRRGYRVEGFYDGASAMQALMREKPFAIISELSVPEMDGFSLRRALLRSSEFASIPFVLCSKRKDDASINESFRLGIEHFLQKPYFMSELSAIVDSFARNCGS